MKPMEIRIKSLPPFPTSKPKNTPEEHKDNAREKESARFLKKKIESFSLGKGFFLPPPAIQLPPAEIVDENEKIWKFYPSNRQEENQIGRYPFPSGIPHLLPQIALVPESPASPKGDENFTESLIQELKKGVKSETKRLVKTTHPKRQSTQKNSNVKLGVEGPIAERRILYRPRPPKVRADQTVQIRLKFWVTPNGIVDQIVPLERGGTNLESVAIQYLKQWKFEPLPPEVKQERQWGILTVKFVVK